MSMIANYIMIDKSELDKMKNMDNDELVDYIEELSEDSNVYDMDKLWDGVHFLLTGTSASEPIKGNKYSEAVIGVKCFIDAEDCDWVAYSEIEYIKEMVHLLKCIDYEKLHTKFTIEDFISNEIYPNIWSHALKDLKYKESLYNEIISEIKGLLEFYESAIGKEKNIVVSIY